MIKLVYILLIFAFSSVSAKDQFTFLQLTPQSTRIELGKVFINKDYLLELTLPSKDGLKVKVAKANCSCLQLLEKPLSNSKEVNLTFLFKAIRTRKFKVSLDVVFENGESSRYFVIGESTSSQEEPEIAAALLKSPALSVNKSLYVTANRLVRNQSKYFFVDLRNTNEFLKARIPQSLNLTSLGLRTNDFLKSQTVILISNQLYSKELESQCKQLRSSGFKKAYILSGSLQSWVEAGGKLTGVAKPEVTFSISAKEAFVASAFKETYFVSDNPQVDKVCNQFIKKTAIAKLKRTPFTSFICFTYEDFQAIKDMEDLNAVWIESGIEGYRDFLEHYTKILSPKSIRLRQKASDCVGCP
ncbi:MAG: rhodanese-like domain-containing protein [Lentisphaerales bacterium]|nr:rhodanese-like domain-containing protein [Lentisphaerales bacterium]